MLIPVTGRKDRKINIITVLNILDSLLLVLLGKFRPTLCDPMVL